MHKLHSIMVIKPLPCALSNHGSIVSPMNPLAIAKEALIAQAQAINLLAGPIDGEFQRAVELISCASGKSG